jgi:uncharacterized membrane protein YoaK (UPF0700 family)
MVKQTAVPQTDSLLSAVLLATTGGLLDAVVYMLHGHVFANAMTGNVILLGVSAFSRDWQQADRHVAPIAAFLLGVAASRVIRILPRHRAALLVLLLEILVLALLGFVPASFPEMTFTAIVSFVSAFQVSTFRTVGRFSYNSTFITGNLREASESFVNHFLDPDPAIRHRDFAKARKLATICLFFLLGAMLGAWGAPYFGNRTLWLVLPLLLVVVTRVLVVHSAESE